MQKYPLYIYILGVLVVWAGLLGYVWLVYTPHFIGALDLCAMFLAGMLAMYIAMHMYRWR